VDHWGVPQGGGPGVQNHPVGVVPSPNVSVPDGWPLGPGGTITCSTCHESFPGTQTGYASLRQTDYRPADAPAFCGRCHAYDYGGSAVSAHWQVVGKAHVLLDDDRAWASGGALDYASRQCLGCHDGVNARESVNGLGSGGAGIMSGRWHGEHPIGQDYQRSRKSRSASPMRPVQLLDPEIRLPGGRVSCVSCHNLYSATPGRLAVPINESRLCLSCHDL
jgi:predicted CXXCH cytochrome family protein